MGIFDFGRPPIIGWDGFAFQRVDEVGGAGWISVSTGDIRAWEGIGVASAAHFDGLRMDVLAEKYSK